MDGGRGEDKEGGKKASAALFQPRLMGRWWLKVAEPSCWLRCLWPVRQVRRSMVFCEALR